MNKWDELTMAEKAEMMKVAVRNGITKLQDIRDRYNEYAKGGDTKEEFPSIVPFTQKGEVIITPDTEYNQYLNTLPDNQRFTPNDKYDSYLYWKLNSRPRNFEEAYNRDMFHYDHSDNSYHANSIAWGDDGIGYFMKPKDHDTVKYELDWFNKGLITEEGGHQRPETSKEKAESDIFRRNYRLANDPTRPNYYTYQPVKHSIGGPLVDAAMAHYYDGKTESSQQMNIGLNVPKVGLDVQGWPNYTTEQIIAYGDENERRRKAILDTYLNFVTESNDATAVANGRPQNQHLVDKAIQGAKAHAAWEKEHPNLTAWGNVLGAVPFAVAAAPMLEAAASSTAGQGITTGLNYIANAAKATPYVSKVLPWAEAALATGPATHGIQEMQEGVFTPMTALEISPLVPTTIGIGNNLYLPHLREHIYASKTPIGYDGMLPAAKRIAEGVLSGKRADIENPFWFNNESAETLAKEFAFVPKNISEAEKTQYLHDFGQRALRARADIWRMYNRLPQKYNTFVESEKYPGAYTAPEDIKVLKWIPFPDKNVDPGDFVNSVGGNVGLPKITNLGKGIPDAGYTSKEFGVTTLSDLWDLHPFSRPNDRLISRIQRGYKKAFNTTEAPEFKQLKPLDERLAKFEVGKLINAKPIMVKNDVPWTMDRKLITDANGNLNFRTSYTQGFHSDNIVPQSVIDWKAGKPIIEGSDIQLNPDSYNFLRVKLTTKSRRKK